MKANHSHLLIACCHLWQKPIVYHILDPLVAKVMVVFAVVMITLVVEEEACLKRLKQVSLTIHSRQLADL